MRDAGGAERDSVLALHVSIGMAILLLTAMRLGWRITHTPPAMPAAPLWERRAARSAHAIFYVLLFAIPLLGWLNVSSSGVVATSRLFGFLPWPSIPGVAGESALGAFAETAHRTLAYSLCVVLLFHVAGALRHHSVDPDRGFARILPGSRHLFGWRTGTAAAMLIILFVLASGFTDSVLPRQMHLVQWKAVERAAIDPRKSSVFTSVMQPILDEKCVRCHGSSAQKGGLRLDSFASVIRGGESGQAIAPGKADESELVRRILMPPSSRDAMPPSGRPALTLGEGQLILWWIAAGADEQATILAANPPPLVQGILEDLGVRNESLVFAHPVTASDPQALAKLRENFQAQLLFSGGGFLRVQPRFDRKLGEPLRLDALAAVVDQLVWLDLSNANVPEAQLVALGRFHKLQRLNLSGTQAGDATIAQLIKLPYLENLNLYRTAVTDSTLDALGRMPSLASVYLSETAVTPAGVARFHETHPNVRVVWQAGERDDATAIKKRSDSAGEKVAAGAVRTHGQAASARGVVSGPRPAGSP